VIVRSIGSEEPVVCCSTASDRPDWIVLCSRSFRANPSGRRERN